MKNLFDKTTLIGLMLFILLALYNIVQEVRTDLLQVKKIEIIQEQIDKIDSNSEIVLELQRERGLTNIYFANKTKKHKDKVLSQRDQVKKVIINSSSTFNNSLANIRKKVDKLEAGRVYIFDSYSELIRGLLLNTRSLTYGSDDKVIKNELMIYNDLNSLQEVLGQLRAKVGLVLSSKVLTKEADIDITRSNILFQHQLETTFINDLLSSYDYTKQISKTKCLKKSFLISKNIALELSKGEDILSAIEWFKLSTCAIDKINSFVNEQLMILHEEIENKIEIAKNKRINHLIFWLFGLSVLAIFVFIAFRKSKELRTEQALLQNYKQAIDFSTMVSTTDKNGLITHVNETFASTSGYTEKEFLGKTLGLVKSSNDISNYKLEGKKHKDVLEYIKKDGTKFWADTYTMPILDDKNEVVEYISVMCDISRIIALGEEIQETQRELLYRLGEAVESRNKESGNHIKRVALYSELLAKLYKLTPTECYTLFAASSMHDVGKIAIPDRILLKPAKLDAEEWATMKTHSEIGYKLFKDSDRELLKAAAEVSYQHHEHYNGKGYPRGLKGEEIAIFGRIVAIADVFDALGSRRPYKEPWKLEKIIELLREESGEQFDPELVKLFLDNIDEFVAIRNKYEDKA